MSAAATAAGYLYASGRLRGRNAREEGDASPERKADRPAERPAPRNVRVAVLGRRPRAHEAPRADAADPAREERPRRQPKIEYRTRRWKPE